MEKAKKTAKVLLVVSLGIGGLMQSQLGRVPLHIPVFFPMLQNMLHDLYLIGREADLLAKGCQIADLGVSVRGAVKISYNLSVFSQPIQLHSIVTFP